MKRKAEARQKLAEDLQMEQADHEAEIQRLVSQLDVKDSDLSAMRSKLQGIKTLLAAKMDEKPYGRSPTSVPPLSPYEDSASPPSPSVSNPVRASVTVSAPTLSDATKADHRAKILYAKIWGDFVPYAAITSRLVREWNFMHGEVSSGDKITLNPPALEGPNTTLEEDDLDEAFFNALGIIHHNPDVNFDADMSFSSPSLKPTKSNNSKRRKRDDEDACSPNSIINYD
uniref:Uncharacterized protein n=1 Tax=Chenopodium quinoa TaxID=63459 RepID=A0A803M8A4_CHEQI